jgi:hypothetical protein
MFPMGSIQEADPGRARAVGLLRCFLAALVMLRARRCLFMIGVQSLHCLPVEPAPAMQQEDALAGTAEAQRQVVRPWRAAWQREAVLSNVKMHRGLHSHLEAHPGSALLGCF